jgi:hypothetical protein
MRYFNGDYCMTAPFKKRDASHARIYGKWERLPAWNLL